MTANYYPSPSSNIQISARDPWRGSTIDDTYADGIDLRRELHSILYGNGITSGKGHWVVLRKFDTTQYSQYWNDVTNEAVGGPMHPYTDHVVRTYRKLVSTDRSGINADMDTPIGHMITPYNVYYFEYTLNPRKGTDQVLELDWNRPEKPTNITPTMFTERFNITNTHKFRLDEFGRIEYWYCPVEENMGRW